MICVIILYQEKCSKSWEPLFTEESWVKALPFYHDLKYMIYVAFFLSLLSVE